MTVKNLLKILDMVKKDNMGNVAFLFPGQGSQEIGMAKDLFESDPYFRQLITFASDYTGEDLEKLCLYGPEKRLILASFLQPLLTSVSLGYFRYILKKGIKPDYVLGHSLGEITALAAAGVVDDTLSITIAAKRGELMDDAASKCSGTMMAVLFVPAEEVKKLLREMNEPDNITLANDNAVDQVVLSGSVAALNRFAQKVKETKIGKCRELLVSGPWHSHFLTSAREQFEQWVKDFTFNTPRIPLILNAVARPESDPAVIKNLITWQLTKPVYWRQCMEYLKTIPIDTILEIGPGRILTGLIRKNHFPKQTNVFSINSIDSIEQLGESLSALSAPIHNKHNVATARFFSAENQ